MILENKNIEDLINWVAREVEFIEELLMLVADGTTLHHKLHGKKEAFEVVLENLKDETS